MMAVVHLGRPRSIITNMQPVFCYEIRRSKRTKEYKNVIGLAVLGKGVLKCMYGWEDDKQNRDVSEVLYLISCYC